MEERERDDRTRCIGGTPVPSLSLCALPKLCLEREGRG